MFIVQAIFAQLNTDEEENITMEQVLAKLREINPDMEKNLRVRNPPRFPLSRPGFSR